MACRGAGAQSGFPNFRSVRACRGFALNRALGSLTSPVPLCRRGGRPTVLLLRPKKVGKEKASRSQGRYAIPCAARGRRGRARTRLRLRQSLALIRLPLRCSALPHGVGNGVGGGCGFGIGRYGGQSPNSPHLWRALRVLRSEIVIRPPKPGCTTICEVFSASSPDNSCASSYRINSS